MLDMKDDVTYCFYSELHICGIAVTEAAASRRCFHPAHLHQRLDPQIHSQTYMS